MSHLVQDTCELQESRPLNQLSCQSAVNQKHTSIGGLFDRTRLGLYKQEVTSETLVLAQARLLGSW